MAWQNNTAELRGTLAGPPELSHLSRGTEYYTVPLITRRLSGARDRANVILPGALLPCLPEPGEKLWLRGELRSFNNRSGFGSRLVITVLARQLCPTREEHENFVELTGALCRAPVYRTTPMGREICDVMLAVNRRYGRSDYLPCIAWGKNALLASAWAVGRTVSLRGRFQSRVYVKTLETGETREKTAYEVSVTAFDPDPEPSPDPASP